MTSLGGHCAPLELQGFSANISYQHLAALRPGHRPGLRGRMAAIGFVRIAPFVGRLIALPAPAARTHVTRPRSDRTRPNSSWPSWSNAVDCILVVL